MKKYSLLIASFLITTCIFIALLIIQKQNENKNQLIEAYIFNEFATSFQSVTKDMLKPIYLKNDNNLLNDVYVDISTLDKYVLKNNVSKNKLLCKNDIILKDSLNEFVQELDTEKIVIPISNIDSVIYSMLNPNRYINLYVHVSKNLEPSNTADYLKMNMGENSLILYLEKVKPVCYLNSNGNVVNGNDMIKSVVFEVSKTEAMYLNYIKGKAGFNITVI